MVYTENLAYGSYLVPNLSNMKCAQLLFGARDNLGILLVYQSSHYTTDPLTASYAGLGSDIEDTQT